MKNTFPDEISYVDLLTALYESIKSDQCLPNGISDEALTKVNRLQQLLWPYSA